jgi:hypothetical protein
MCPVADVRDLGEIEGRPVTEPAGGPPDPSGPECPGAGMEVVRDIREAHRRGPKHNSRPLPNWVKRFAWVLDDAIPVPGTRGRRVGVDGLISFIPGIGDAAGVALSMVVVVVGIGAGVSVPTILRMMLNVGFEAVVGIIPFAGAVFDLAYKANDRNVRLIERDLADRRGTSRSSAAILALAVLAVIASIVLTFVILVAGVVAMFWLLGRLVG